MSYDLNVWSVDPASFPASLPVVGNWTLADNRADYNGGNWHIAIGASQLVDDEDLPEDVSVLMAGVRYLTELNLEPFHAPKSARKLIHQVAKHIATQTSGVVEDPQTDSFMTPSGIQRFVAKRRPEQCSLLFMLWRFLDASVPRSDIWPWLVDYFKKQLPEALPRRYGLWEPPPHKLEETGEEHLLRFLSDKMYDHVIWYTRRPVAGMYMSLSPDCWVTRRGRTIFYPNQLNIEFELDVLHQPGWKEQLRRVWLDISLLIRPFYGDARVLHGFFPGRGTYAYGQDTQSHPASGIWYGIPQTLGVGMVVGPPLTRVWQTIHPIGAAKGDLVFVSLDDWLEPRDLSTIVGEIPSEVRRLSKGGWSETPGGTWNYDETLAGYPMRFPPEPPQQR
jgi:hypothetical protein